MNRYEIRVVSHVEPLRARALGCDECRWLPDGESVLAFESVDAAATYGLLARLRDAGLEIVGMARVRSDALAVADRETSGSVPAED